MSRKIPIVLGSAMVLFALLLASGIVSGQEPTRDCEVEPCPAWIVDAWAASPHNDAEAEAFNHWNEDDPQEVPTSCARCHSTLGYIDYLGDDGTEVEVVDTAAPIGTTVTCSACHSPSAVTLESVTFPSGITATENLEDSARCMVCHQGRASVASVNSAVEGLDPDTPSADLRFINIHYFAAAATLFGGDAQSGYEYEGKIYQPRNVHVPNYDTCAECHNPHTLEVRVDECSVCHVGVASEDDLHSIRMNGSKVDYDGDGNTDEGIYDELKGIQELLYAAIQTYAADVAGTPIIYDAHSYPYFFADDNGNGEVDGEEGGYASFTPRLLGAAYNYQAFEKDPGAFAHNPKYYVELMYDSLESLNEALPDPFPLMVTRDDAGHFEPSGEPFRHWDEDGEVPASCSKCHTSEGLPFLLENGVTIAFEPSDSLTCSTCHKIDEGFAFYQSDEVTFPSGAVVSFGEGVPSNLCINCHQGRESTASVNAAIVRSGAGADDVSEDLSFRNIHYFAAGATLFGSDTMGIYQYEGKEYAGRNMHVPGYDVCAGCHDVHALTVKVDECAVCHGEFEEPQEIRMMSGDWDGDSLDEGVYGELDDMRAALLAAIQAYAADVVGTPIKYDEHAYPYWFNDDAESGRYATWTPRLLRAAYNYQYAMKDPGAFAHNPKYVVQALYDSIEDLGGDVSGMTRP